MTKEQLYRFYAVDNDEALINIMAHHIDNLQDKITKLEKIKPVTPLKVREG